MWAGFIWLKIWVYASFCEHGHEHMGSINLGNLLSGKGPISFSRTVPVNTARTGTCCHLNARVGRVQY